MNTAKHVCPLCDYVYENAKGDPAHGIPAGTAFESLPTNWSHPGCNGRKDTFEVCTCVSLAADAPVAAGQKHRHRSSND